MAVHHVCVWCPQGQKMVLDLPGLVSHYMVVGNQTQVFYESNKYS